MGEREEGGGGGMCSSASVYIYLYISLPVMLSHVMCTSYNLENSAGAVWGGRRGGRGGGGVQTYCKQPMLSYKYCALAVVVLCV